MQSLINRAEQSQPLLVRVVGARAYAEVQAMPGKNETAASFALSALVNINADKVSGEELASLIAELSRIANDMSTDPELLGVQAVVDSLDDAHTAATEIKLSGPDLCTACNGSGEGRYDGTKCCACGGKGVVISAETFEGLVEARGL